MSRRQRLQSLSNRRQSVFVGYVHPDQVDAGWMNCLLALKEHDEATTNRLTGRIHIGSGPRIASARNALVRQFLVMPSKPEWLWMIDTDMLFTPDLLDQMFKYAHPMDCPVLGALCFAGGKGAIHVPTIYQFMLDEDGQPYAEIPKQFPEDTLIKVDGTGAAAMLVHRSVLEAIGERWGNKTAYPWFAETEFNLREFGEDLTFCMRVNGAGFPIHVHSGIVVGHHKLHVLDDRSFKDQQARETAGTLPEWEEHYYKSLGLLPTAA